MNMTRRFHPSTILVLLLALAPAGVPADDAGPSGLTPIAIPARPGSLAPAITVDSSGDAIVTWLEPSGSGHALKFAVLDETGAAKAGTIANGRDWFVNWADTPQLFAVGDGSWLAHWLVRSGDAPYAYGIRLARSEDRGRTWSEPVRLHEDESATEHGFVSYFEERGAGAGAAWLDGRATGAAEGSMTLRTASIRNGRPRSERLLDERVCDCCQTASARTDEGPVVVYRDRSEAEIRDIAIVRRIDGRWSAPRVIHADGWEIAGCPVNGPAITADGRFVAVGWFTMAAGTPRVQVAVSDDAGATFGEPVVLTPGTALGRVQLARHAGDVLVTWMNETEAGAELRLARIDRGGNVLENRPVTTLAAGRVSGFPRIVRTGDRLLVVWTTTEAGDDGRPQPRVAAGAIRLGPPDPG